MPEYLAPGVYVEEVSFRSKSIEGVPTSTTGFAGLARFGPVYYLGGPKNCEPRLITSFTEFERVYGRLDTLSVGPSVAAAEERLPYLAHAARAYFLNGGVRLYVSRVFVPRDATTDTGIASRAIAVAGTTATWRARWPGSLGNVWVDVQPVRSKNIAYSSPDFGGIVQVKRAKKGAVVEVIAAGTPPVGNTPPVFADLAQIDIDPTDGRQLFLRNGVAFAPPANAIIQLIELPWS